MASLAGAAHVELLTFLSARTHNTAILYLAIALPALICAVIRPWESLNGWYRWPVLWIIWLTTAFGIAGLGVGDAVVLLTLFLPVRKEDPGSARDGATRSPGVLARIYRLSQATAGAFSKPVGGRGAAFKRPTAAAVIARQAGGRAS